MITVDPALRLSAQRALLGAISPQVRLIKVRRDEEVIRLTTWIAEPLGDDAVDALAVAATEIIADFPDCLIEERLIVSQAPLPVEDCLAEGWVYRRAELPVSRRDRLDVWHDGSATLIIAASATGGPLDLGEHEVEDLIMKLKKALAEELG
jgi:hypothetical protein